MKVPEKMLLAIEDCIKKGYFESRSEFFRVAIRELINEELHSKKWEIIGTHSSVRPANKLLNNKNNDNNSKDK